MSNSNHARGVRPIIKSITKAYAAANSLEEFITTGGRLLLEGELNPAQICSFVHESWDPNSCLPHMVDTDNPPFLIDLHAANDWCLRATVWPSQHETDWMDVPHSHFGFIATTPVTEIAYLVRVYSTFDCIDEEVVSEPFRRGDIYLIKPQTIHEIILPEESFGISVSLRTRSVRDTSEEWNRSERKIDIRTKSALDRKRAVLNYLEAGTRREH